MTPEPEVDGDEQLTRAARALREDWHSPHLWPAIERDMCSRGPRRWQMPLTAAACVILAVATGWIAWRGVSSQDAPAAPLRDDQRLLSEQALADVDRAEAAYARAIEDLSRAAAPVLETRDTPVLAQLRERLMVIDAALAEARMEIERNPFNAQMRGQLLIIYQEKQRTLMEIAERADVL